MRINNKSINFAASIEAMKKRIVLILTVLILGLQPIFGQIIYTDEDAGHHTRQVNTGTDVFGVMVPQQNIDADQWKVTPLSDGLLLLVGLGGAYLLKKKRSQK